jgi:hypothetical protein
MSDSVEMFLSENRTTVRWLDDIIAVLLDSPNGTAHVHAIAKVLSRNYLRDIDTIEQTVTRRINDFCSDAHDFKKDKEHDLFKRVAPATYRLRSFPNRPNVLELVTIAFDEPAMNSIWEVFCQKASSQFRQKWRSASNRKKIEAFMQNLVPGKSLYAEYERRKAFYARD